MESVNIGIGSNDDVVISEIVDGVLYPQCLHDEIQLLVLVHYLLLLPLYVIWLPTQREHRLRLGVPCINHIGTYRIPFREENG